MPQERQSPVVQKSPAAFFRALIRHDPGLAHIGFGSISDTRVARERSFDRLARQEGVPKPSTAPQRACCRRPQRSKSRHRHDARLHGIWHRWNSRAAPAQRPRRSAPVWKLALFRYEIRAEPVMVEGWQTASDQAPGRASGATGLATSPPSFQGARVSASNTVIAIRTVIAEPLPFCLLIAA